MSPERMTSETVTLWVHESARALAAARAPLDDANVFPVADSDTGTNLWLTVRQGAARLDAVRRTAPAGAPPDVVGLLRALARGALDGARGNSGVILSEYLRGFVAGAAGTSSREPEGLGAEAVRAGLVEAARRANESVGQPIGGTILTAATWAARAASFVTPRPGAPVPVEEVVAAAVDGARQAVGRSPQDLPILGQAGLVDAGAVGLLLVLGALDAAVRGTVGAELDPVVLAAPRWAESQETAGSGTAPAPVGGEDTWHHAVPLAASVDEGGEFEVMLAAVLTDLAPPAGHAPAARPPAARGAASAGELRERLGEIGDSVVVVDDGDGEEDLRVRVHVHADSPAAVVDVLRGWSVGRAVVHRLTQAREHSWAVVGATASPGLLAAVARSAKVALWAQDGSVPDTDLERALVDARASTVVLVPGRVHVDPTLAARAAAVGEAAGITVVTLLPPGGGPASDAHLVAALAVAEMIDVTTEDAAAAVTTLARAVTAVRHRATELGSADEDDLAMLVDEVTRLLAEGAEVLSLVVDDDVPEPVVTALAAAARDRGAEPVVVRSGLPGTWCMLGAEPGAVVDA